MTSSDFHTNPAGTRTSGSGSPTTQQQYPASGAFNPFQSFIAASYTPSPNTAIKRFVNIYPSNEMSTSYGAVAEKRSQGRAAQGGASLETSLSNTSPATNTSQVSGSSIARPIDGGTSLAGSLDGQRLLRRHVSKSVAKDSASASTPSGGSRSFDSLPYIRTNRLPPMQLKTAPSALWSASASKRKRDGSAEPLYEFSSSDEIDGAETQVLPRTHGSNTVYGEAQTTAGASATSQRYYGVSSSHPDVPQTQRQWNGPNMIRTRAAHSPIVLSSSDDEDDIGSIENAWRVNPFNRQSHHSVLSGDGKYLRNVNRSSITGGVDPQRMAPEQPRGKINCEERRLQLCAAFNSAKFDAMIYGQAEATSPPEGVFVPVAQSKRLRNDQSSGEGRGQLYMKLDPRIHWPHNRSGYWYNAKMEEIKSRGGRKANFGKAAQRMRQQRLEAEQREEEERQAVEQGLPVPANKQPQPWSHHRHMDFGDVPEEELPTYVRKNPEWLQATAWMRENREQTLRRNKEAATLRAAGLPCEHLFARSGR